MARFMQAVVFAVIVGLTYLRLGTDQIAALVCYIHLLHHALLAGMQYNNCTRCFSLRC